jgi:hypothetical protein
VNSSTISKSTNPMNTLIALSDQAFDAILKDNEN